MVKARGRRGNKSSGVRKSTTWGKCVTHSGITKFILPRESLTALLNRPTLQAAQVLRAKCTNDLMNSEVNNQVNIKDTSNQRNELELKIENLETTVTEQNAEIEAQHAQIQELKRFQESLLKEVENLEYRSEGCIRMIMDHETKSDIAKLKEKRLMDEKERLTIVLTKKDEELQRIEGDKTELQALLSEKDAEIERQKSRSSSTLGLL